VSGPTVRSTSKGNRGCTFFEPGLGQSIDPRLRRQRPIKQMLKLAAISVALIVNFGATYAQNMPAPKPEDAERDAFQTPTAGNKNSPAPAENKDRHPEPSTSRPRCE
jgi:hypothetical protein